MRVQNLLHSSFMVIGFDYLQHPTPSTQKMLINGAPAKGSVSIDLDLLPNLQSLLVEKYVEFKSKRSRMFMLALKTCCVSGLTHISSAYLTKLSPRAIARILSSYMLVGKLVNWQTVDFDRHGRLRLASMVVYPDDPRLMQQAVRIILQPTHLRVLYVYIELYSDGDLITLLEFLRKLTTRRHLQLLLLGPDEVVSNAWRSMADPHSTFDRGLQVSTSVDQILKRL